MKPRVRVLPKNGDADRCRVSFFAPSGVLFGRREVMVSSCSRAVNRDKPSDEMGRLVNKVIREFEREYAAESLILSAA